MQTYKKITDAFIRVVEIIETLLIAAIVGVMLYEMILRNGFNKSFRASTELCGFLFMWMAFLGVIILYDRDRLITLDMIYVRVPESFRQAFWFIGKAAAMLLGVVMIIAYVGMYPINKTSYFSTMQWLSKAWHFLPMAIAGGFIVVKTVWQVLDRVMTLTGATKGGKEA
ncbi:MAG: TRAP transporter small permease [Clostridiales bacterium]|nr:TRAP transporter small permease [Clostridiales bacterium]